MDIIQSKRGKPIILYLGYKYNQKKIYQSTDILWACANRSCTGNIKTDSNITTVILQKEHSICAPDVAKNEVLLCLSNTKKRIREECSPVPQIYEEEIRQNVIEKGLDFVTSVPRFHSIKKQLYTARHSSLGEQSLPKHRREIIVPEKFKEFVFYDSMTEDKLLLFANEGEYLLRQGNVIFGDGTFKCCPSIYRQIYTIHIDMGSTDEKTFIVPAIYALLPNKTEDTYIKLFRILKEKVPDFNPSEFHVDFEKAAINAFLKVFPNAEIKGCNFHFKQALWRKTQELGLVVEYREREDVKQHLRMCAALAHIPTEAIDEGWLQIMENVPDMKKSQNSMITSLTNGWNHQEIGHVLTAVTVRQIQLKVGIHD